MSTKKKLLCVLIVLIGIGICVGMYFLLQDKAYTHDEELTPILNEEPAISSQEQVFRDENVSLFEDTISSQDDVTVSEYRINVTNMGLLSEYGYSQKSIDALLPYLDAYFDYYDPDGGTYTAEIGAEAGHTRGLPHFLIKVDMDGTPFWVNCLFNPSDDEYIFRSDFGDPY